jgi:hypothetical protein
MGDASHGFIVVEFRSCKQLVQGHPSVLFKYLNDLLKKRTGLGVNAQAFQHGRIEDFSGARFLHHLGFLRSTFAIFWVYNFRLNFKLLSLLCL